MRCLQLELKSIYKSQMSCVCSSDIKIIIDKKRIEYKKDNNSCITDIKIKYDLSLINSL